MDGLWNAQVDLLLQGACTVQAAGQPAIVDAQRVCSQLSALGLADGCTATSAAGFYRHVRRQVQEGLAASCSPQVQWPWLSAGAACLALFTRHNLTGWEAALSFACRLHGLMGVSA